MELQVRGPGSYAGVTGSATIEKPSRTMCTRRNGKAKAESLLLLSLDMSSCVSSCVDLGPPLNQR